jgi:hypothetical protein
MFFILYNPDESPLVSVYNSPTMLALDEDIYVDTNHLSTFDAKLVGSVP